MSKIQVVPMPVERQYFCSRDAVKCNLWLERCLRSSLCPGVRGRETLARMDGLRSDNTNRRWYVCHQPSWGIVWRIAMVGRCRVGLSDTCDAGRARQGRGEGLVPLPVTAITLLVVLDRLDIRDTAVCTSRCSARGLVCGRVAAAVLVYDLGAHTGENRRGRRVAQRGAPSAGGAEGRG